MKHIITKDGSMIRINNAVLETVGGQAKGIVESLIGPPQHELKEWSVWYIPPVASMHEVLAESIKRKMGVITY